MLGRGWQDVRGWPVTETRTLSAGGVSLTVDWVPAPQERYRWAQRKPRGIVLHSAETWERSSVAESLGQYLAGPNGPTGASWHYADDDDSIVQSVEDQHIAWHAGVVNAYTIGIEQAGRASQTAEQWGDPYSSRMLERTALLLAYLSARHGIPLVFVPAAVIASQHQHGGFRGVSTHWEVTKAFRVKGGHTDPGTNYPMAAVLARALELGGQEVAGA